MLLWISLGLKVSSKGKELYETILGSKIDHISVGQPTSDISKTQNLIEVLKGIRRECTSLQIGEHTRRKLTIAFHYALKSKSGIDEVLERFNEIILEAEAAPIIISI